MSSAHGWPLVGRAEEMLQLERLLTGGRSHGVVVAGPSGVSRRADLGGALDNSTASAPAPT